jgi:hypothetical protein
MVFLGEDLPCPTGDATANQEEACHPYANARYEACEAQCDAKGENDWPRGTRRNLDWRFLIVFRSMLIHHKSSSDQIND